MQLDGLPPLNWLRAFETSARHLSFTLAASELNLTQSAVSQHVRSLESFLGRDLFLRKTRAIELTEAGANYLPVVREAFQMLASGTRAFTGGDRGRTLTLHCNMAFSVHWLAPRLKRLYAAHPWIVLNIVTPIWDPERQAANAQVEIRFGRPEDMSPAAQQLTKERFHVPQTTHISHHRHNTQFEHSQKSVRRLLQWTPQRNVPAIQANQNTIIHKTPSVFIVTTHQDRSTRSRRSCDARNECSARWVCFVR